MRLKLYKCSFGGGTAKKIGHVLDPTGLRSSDEHIDSISKLNAPACGKRLMRFLGVVNSFAAFASHFAETAVPLYEVLIGTVFTKKRRHEQRLAIPD